MVDHDLRLAVQEAEAEAEEQNHLTANVPGK
jgi:hypothetical protein